MGVRAINNNQGGNVKLLRTSPGINQGGVWCGSYLLDSYPGAQAAYSLRKLRKADTGAAIRVRRDSDNAEMNIGFTGDNLGPRLDEKTLTDFVGAGSGFITRWYDQSGNARDGYQNTAANQPRIVQSGNIIRDGNRPSIDANNLNWGFGMPVATYLNGITQFFTLVVTTPKGPKNSSFPTLYSTWRSSGALKIGISYSHDVTDRFAMSTRFFAGSPRLNVISTISSPTNTKRLITGQLNFSIGTATLWENGNQTGFNPNYFIGTMDSISYMANTENLVGYGSFQNYNGYVQEIVVYTSNQVSNRQAMEIDTNRYYGIY